jgi:hypothetical protein
MHNSQAKLPVFAIKLTLSLGLPASIILIVMISMAVTAWLMLNTWLLTTEHVPRISVTHE